MHFLKKQFLFLPSIVLFLSTGIAAPAAAPAAAPVASPEATPAATKLLTPAPSPATKNLSTIVSSATTTGSDQSSLAPWLRPRDLSSFQALFQRSPFSLATAEDSSPISERYMITGVITIDGEEQIFIMDRNDQSRDLLTKKPNAQGMSLINILHDNDPSKLKATIRANGETGVINNVDLAENNPKGARPGMPGSAPGMYNNYPRNGTRPPSPGYPGTQGYPNTQGYPRTSGYPNTQGYPSSYPGHYPSSQNPPPGNPNDRRIIRRPPISSQPGMPSSYPQTAPYNYQQGNYQQGMPNNYQPRTPGY